MRDFHRFMKKKGTVVTKSGNGKYVDNIHGQGNE